MNENNKGTFYIFLTLAMIAWGASWVHAKVLGNYITASELIVYRYAITIVSFIPVFIFLKKDLRIDMKNLFLAFVAAFFLTVYSIFYFNGVKYGTAGLGGALVTTFTPILTFILLVSFFGKPFFKKDMFALFLGGIGVLTILNIWKFSSEEIFSLANINFIAACVFWAGLTISNSKLTKVSPLVFTFYVYIFTAIMGYFMTSFESGDIFQFDWIFWLNLFSSALISTTFATSMFFIAITKIGANEANSFIFLVPFNAIFLSFLFLGEDIYMTTILGTILTIIAVSIVNNIKIPKLFRKKI